MSETGTEARINGINIHYRVYGEGEPLLLIMGLGGNADWWHERFLERLEERFQVVTFDNRGTGRTDKPEGPYSIPQMASDAVGLMDHLDWSSADVMGVSMGGMIAQELILNYPERVRRLVLACTNCGGQEQVLASPEALSLLTLPQGELSKEELLKATLPLLFQPEYIEEHREEIDETMKRLMIAPTPPKSFMNQFQGISVWSDHSRLGDIKQPTLVITGDEDILIPPENSRILADAIPGCRLVEIKGGAHGFISQFPDEAADEVLAFLT